MTPILLRSTIRLLVKNKVLAFVKIGGLALGSAIFLLTVRFCLEEINYDKQHAGYPHIYRYVHRVNTPEGLQSAAFTSSTTGPALKERYPEVLAYTRTISPRLSVRNPLADVAFNERRFAFVDSNFLDVFRFPLTTPHNGILAEPLSIILTPAMVSKYFGNSDPIGKTLVINNALEFVVKGVFAEDFRRTHFNFDFVASFSSLETIRNHPQVSGQIPASLNLDTKGYNAFYTYLRLAPGASAELESKFPAFIEEFRGKGRSERLKPTLQPMQSIHLDSHLLYEIDQNGSRTMVVAYLAIGVIVLLIACINYINLSTAELITRAKGIGLKKILGVTRSALIMNHLGETVVVTGLSLVAGLGVVAPFNGTFNSMVNRTVTVIDPGSLPIVGCIFVVVVLASGLYPALFISRAEGLRAFQGNIRMSRASLLLRNALVYFQLAVSFALVTVSLLMYSQLDFLLNKTPGFDADQLITINASASSLQQRIALKNDLLQATHDITQVGQCSVPPGENLFSYGLARPQHKGEEENRVLVYQSYVDTDFAAAMGIPLEQGRFFSADSPADSDQYLVINRAAALALGEGVMDQTLDIPSLTGGTPAKKTPIGVISDFSFASFHTAVEPLTLEYNPNRCQYLLVRFREKSAGAVLKHIEKSWNHTMPGLPLDYAFMNDRFAKFYESESRQMDLIGSMAVIALGLAALGIFGTTLFMVQRRTREVGIRKMLGSSRASLLLLLMRPAFALVLIACAAGAPLAFLSGTRWLEQYPFRVDISSMMFLSAFLVVLTIVAVTILYHLVRVTRVNPVEVLRMSQE